MTVIVASALVVTGSALALLAGVGLQRFPDVFARMHAATKPATLGLMLVLTGVALRLDRPGDVAKLMLVVALQLVTAPVGAHMVGRAAYRAGTELSPHTIVDELAGVPYDRRSSDDDAAQRPPHPAGAPAERRR